MGIKVKSLIVSIDIMLWISNNIRTVSCHPLVIISFMLSLNTYGYCIHGRFRDFFQTAA